MMVSVRRSTFLTPDAASRTSGFHGASGSAEEIVGSGCRTELDETFQRTPNSAEPIAVIQNTEITGAGGVATAVNVLDAWAMGGERVTG